MRDAATFVGRRRRTMHKCYNVYSTVEMLTTCDGPTVIGAVVPKPDIGRKSRFLPQLGGPRRNIARTFGTEKVVSVEAHPITKLFHHRIATSF